MARVSRGSRSSWRDAGFVTLRRSRRGVLTCLSRRTGVQVGAIFDVRALLTPPLAAERMVRLSHENGVFVQKCLLERKRSYLTEKGLFSCKAPSYRTDSNILRFPFGEHRGPGYSVGLTCGGARRAARSSAMICCRHSMPSLVKAVTASSPTP